MYHPYRPMTHPARTPHRMRTAPTTPLTLTGCRVPGRAPPQHALRWPYGGRTDGGKAMMMGGCPLTLRPIWRMPCRRRSNGHKNS